MAYINRLTPKIIAKITRLMKVEELSNRVLAERFEVSVQTMITIRHKYAPETLGVNKLSKGVSA